MARQPSIDGYDSCGNRSAFRFALTVIDHNRLVGTVPSEMGLLTSLNTLVLYENVITRSMPALVCEVVRPWIDCNEIFFGRCVRNIADIPCG